MKELGKDADEEQTKVAYGLLAKYYPSRCRSSDNIFCCIKWLLRWNNVKMEGMMDNKKAVWRCTSFTVQSSNVSRACREQRFACNPRNEPRRTETELCIHGYNSASWCNMSILSMSFAPKAISDSARSRKLNNLHLASHLTLPRCRILCWNIIRAERTIMLKKKDK